MFYSLSSYVLFSLIIIGFILSHYHMFYVLSLGSHQMGLGSGSLSSLGDYLLIAVLNLLKKEVSEHGRHLNQYFHLFLMYSGLGIAEVSILLCILYR